MPYSSLILNAKISTMTLEKPYGLIENGAIVIEDGLISWVGEQTKLPNKFSNLPEHNLEGKLITPALIDCHTHLVYGGSRAGEFEMRLNGVSYEEIS